MATNTKNPATSTKSAAELAFEKESGQEFFLDRPIVEWKKLGDQKLPVKGWLVCEEELNLPQGASRKDSRTTWDAFVIHTTASTRAVKNGDIVDIEVGREVYVAVNPKNASLRAFLGQNVMHEVVILGTGEIEMKGRNAMQDYRVKTTGGTQERKGAFLIGGPGQAKLLKTGSIDNTINEIENATNGAAVAVAP